jgi:large subunit ribosomal protein L6e
LTLGTVALIAEVEYSGKRVVVVEDKGAEILSIVDPSSVIKVLSLDIDQDYLIGRSTRVEVNAGASEIDVYAAAAKVPQLTEHLATPFVLKKGDRPHLLKF